MDSGKFWKHIKDAVTLLYPNLNEFWRSIAPYCLADDAVPPERILAARFPLQEILEMAVNVNDTSSVQDIMAFVLIEYKKLYPDDEQDAPTEKPTAEGNVQSEQGGDPPLPQDGAPAVVNIPPSLWAGKSMGAAISALRESGFSDEIIAVVLAEKMGISKLKVGRFLTPGDGEERENSTYSRRLESASKYVRSRYCITYLEK
jgi:hypothetical protein